MASEIPTAKPPLALQYFKRGGFLAGKNGGIYLPFPTPICPAKSAAQASDLAAAKRRAYHSPNVGKMV